MMSGLSINAMVGMAYGTAKANGFHDKQGNLDGGVAEAQLAAMVPLFKACGNLIEAIRKPDKFDIEEAKARVKIAATALKYDGVVISANDYVSSLGEFDHTIRGSKTEAQAKLVLIISELVEAMEAVETGDKGNYQEELGDALIRIGDDAGDINDQPGHFLGPIDLEAVVLAKNERNKQRGYRHGGKRA